MLDEILSRAGYEVSKAGTAALPAEVPAVPATYVAREAFDELKTLLITTEEPVICALGMGGSGKTVLASFLVRDPDISSSFDRVLW